MMSLQEINRISQAAAKRAARARKQPFVVEAEDLKDFGCVRGIPMFGDYIPEGWKLVNTYFVDSSGFGQPGEPALTIDEFTHKLVVGRGYAVLEAGQFQVYMGEYVRDLKDDTV